MERELVVLELGLVATELDQVVLELGLVATELVQVALGPAALVLVVTDLVALDQVPEQD